MRPWIPCLLIGSFALAPQALSAQGCSQYDCQAVNQVTANVGALLRLTLDRSPALTVAASANDIASGQQVLAGPTARVKSNTDWRLEVSASAPTFTADPGARLNKPATDLTWRVGTDGGYTPLSTEPQQAAVGGHTPDTQVAFQYQTRYDSQEDRPGTYSLVVRYTLTTR